MVCRPRGCRFVIAILRRSLPQPLLLQQLLQPHVPDQAEPEGLQEVEGAALYAVEDPQQHDVAVKEIEERTDVKGQAKVELFQPQDALVGGAEEFRLRLPVKALAPPLVLFAREDLGVAQVLLQ